MGDFLIDHLALFGVFGGRLIFVLHLTLLNPFSGDRRKCRKLNHSASWGVASILLPSIISSIFGTENQPIKQMISDASGKVLYVRREETVDKKSFATISAFDISEPGRANSLGEIKNLRDVVSIQLTEIYGTAHATFVVAVTDNGERHFYRRDDKVGKSGTKLGILVNTRFSSLFCCSLIVC